MSGRRPWLRAVALAGGLGAAACAAPNQGSDYAGVQAGLAAFTPWRTAATRAITLPVVRNDPSAECVPFARAISGVAIIGDAHTWWQQAEGKFARGQRPAPGAVMAFRAQPDMPLGHVAVVTAVLDARTVLVAHRNWDGGLGKGRISLDQKVADVSDRGDWSAVRVWHEGTRTLGPNVWRLAGFIYRAPPGQQVAGL